MVRAGIVGRCLRWTLEVLGKKTTSAPNVARCPRWTLEVPGHQPRPGLLFLVPPPPPPEGDLLCPSPEQQQRDDEHDENLPKLPDQVDMDMDESAADGDVNRHLQDGKALKKSGENSLDYADDCGLAKDGDRWATKEEEELTGVQKLHKSEGSKELDEDSDNPDDAGRNPDALSGLTQAHSKNGKSVHWGETVDLDIDESAADGDVNCHLQDGKAIKKSGQNSLDYADDCALAKDGDRWATKEEEELTGVQKLHKSEWSKELDEDNENPDDAKRNPDALFGLTQAHGKNGKSVHWGETVEMDIDDSAADGDVNCHLQDGKTLKKSGENSLDYADDCGLAKGGVRWATKEEELSGVQKLHKSEWSKELDEDSDNPDDAERNSDALSGLTQAHGKNWKSVHWGETTTSAQVSNVPDWKKRKPFLLEQIKTLNMKAGHMKAARSRANCLMDHIDQSLIHGDNLNEHFIQKVDMNIDDSAADGDVNRHLQGGKALKMSGQNLLDYADDGGLAKGGDRRVTEEGELTGVQELPKSEWSKELDADSDNPDVDERNPNALSGLMQAHGKNGKSVHWGETVDRSHAKQQDENLLPLPSLAPTPCPSFEHARVGSANITKKDGFPDVLGYSIYIKNLPLTATAEKVEIEFSRFGPITPGGVQVKRQQVGRNCFGFVEFESKESMRNALLASRVMFEGRPAFVEEKRAPIRDARDRSQNFQPRYFPNYQSQNFQNESSLCVRDGSQNYAHDRRQKYQPPNFPNYQSQNFQNESGLCVRDRSQNYAHDQRQKYQPPNFRNYQPQNVQNESGNYQPGNFQTYQRRNFQNESGNRQPRNFQNESGNHQPRNFQNEVGESHDFQNGAANSAFGRSGCRNQGNNSLHDRVQSHRPRRF